MVLYVAKNTTKSPLDSIVHGWSDSRCLTAVFPIFFVRHKHQFKTSVKEHIWVAAKCLFGGFIDDEEIVQQKQNNHRQEQQNEDLVINPPEVEIVINQPRVPFELAYHQMSSVETSLEFMPEDVFAVYDVHQMPNLGLVCKSLSHSQKTHKICPQS